MSDTQNGRSQMENVIKSYISPLLISIIGVFIWRDMSEMRQDLKLLLTNQSANQVKIATLQEDVSALKSDINSLKTFVYTNEYQIVPTQPGKKEDEQTIRRR